MENAIEVFVTIIFFVLGSSLAFRPRVWVEIIALAQRQGRPGAFVLGLSNLALGALVVAFHDIWSGVPMILTLIGWGLVAKGAITVVAPEWGLRSIAFWLGPGIRGERSAIFIVAGVVLLAISGVFGYHLCCGIQ